MGFFKYGSALLLLLVSLGEASLIPRASIPATDYDVVVIGGGPSGLSALSGLSRVRRRTLLLDSGEYRNALTREMHDIIGNDGTVSAVFRYIARQMISRYPTAYMKNATVTSVTSVAPTTLYNVTSFITTDSTGASYTSRKVILGTGLRDVLPKTPGVGESWARGMFWCVWCDGYEHRDQPLGILGSLVDVVGSVLEVATLYKDIIAFVNGTYTDANAAALEKIHPGWRQILPGYAVVLENATINSIERVQDGGVVKNETADSEFDLFNVHLANGKTVQRAAFITNFPTVQHTDLGAKLGVKIYGQKMDVDASSTRTSVPGVFAIGDASSFNSTNVPSAMYTGKKAAVYAHVELEREHAATFVSPSLRKRGEMGASAAISARAASIDQRMGRELEDVWADLTRNRI